jgi:hypothetical protein
VDEPRVQLRRLGFLLWRRFAGFRRVLVQVVWRRLVVQVGQHLALAVVQEGLERGR